LGSYAEKEEDFTKPRCYKTKIIKREDEEEI